MDSILPQWLIQGIGYLLLIAIAGLPFIGVVMLIRSFIKHRKLKNPGSMKYYYSMIICILIMIASWILNIGWYRMFLTFLAVPVVHAVFFAVVSVKAISKFVLSDALKKYTLISHAAYASAYLLLPDGGDYGPMYVFFGLIRNNAVAHIAGIFSLAAFIVNIIYLTLTLAEVSKLKQCKGPELQ